MLLDHFPRHTRPRYSQIQILKELDSVINRGYRRIVILAPTGIGKSYIAKTLANAMQHSFIVTSTKQLQNQYVQDFPNMSSIKGMSNFPCYQQMDLAKLQDERKAMAKGLTCEKGQCGRQSNGKIVNSCKYKMGDESGKQCIYYRQKTNGLASNQVILNYAIYFQMKKLQATSKSMQRNLVIFDEAHSLENEIVRFLGLDIWAGYLNDVGLSIDRYRLDDMEGIIHLLDDLRFGYGRALMSMEANSINPESLKEVQNYSRMLGRYEKITDSMAMIAGNKDNFVIQTPETDPAGNFKKLSLLPVEINKLAEGFFDADYQVFMSATIDKDNFSRSLGLDDCAFINLTKSPFSRESREIKFLNVRHLSQASSLDDRLEVINQIGVVMQNHQDQRGLILTSSRARCEEIRRSLPRRQRERIQLAHSENEDGSALEDVLAAHKDTRNGVLLSSSLWQGIDLKGDLSRFQIIEKCPYLYLGDKRVRIKKDKDPQWYRYHTIMKLLQGIGRSVRAEEDYAKTYIMDTSVQDLLARNRHMVPLAYHDTIYN